MVLSLLAIAVYFASALRFAEGFYILLVVWIVGALVRPFLADPWEASIASRALAPLVSLIGASYDLLVVETEERPEDRYFGILGLPILASAIYYLILGLQFKDWGNGVWSLPLATVYGSTMLCRRENSRHQSVFFVSGLIVLLVAVACLAMHPLLLGATLTVATFVESLKANASLFVVVGLFFFGNYAKLGLFESPEMHKRLFMIAASLVALTCFSRDPSLRVFIDKLPLGDSLPALTNSAVLVYPPLTGLLLFKRSRRDPLDSRHQGSAAEGT